MFSLGILLIFIREIISSHDSTPIELTLAKVYSSPLIPSSRPEFAVDDDFIYDKPTCLTHEKSRPDSNNNYWLLIDLGIEYERMDRIRFSRNPDTQKDLLQTEIYLVSKISFDRSTVNETLPVVINGRDRDDVGLCGVVGKDDAVTCATSRSARWIVVKRMGDPLDFCLISVYIRDAHQNLFSKLSQESLDSFQSLGIYPRGAPFRRERGGSLSQCRLKCIKERNCHGIVHEERRGNTICQLNRNFVLSAESTLPELKCSLDQCSIEENIAHRGQIVDLVKEEYKDSEKDRLDFAMKLQIDDVKDHNNLILNTIELKGEIVCNTKECPKLEIYQRNQEGNATFCNEIDPLVVGHLEKSIIFCKNSNLLTGVTALYFRWNDESLAKKSFINVTKGSVRLTDERTTLDADLKIGLDDSFQAVTTNGMLDETTVAAIERQFDQTTPAMSNTIDKITDSDSLITTMNDFIQYSTTLREETPSLVTESRKKVKSFENFSLDYKSISDLIEEGVINTKESIQKETTLWLIIIAIAIAFIAVVIVIIVIAYKCSKRSIYDFDVK